MSYYFGSGVYDTPRRRRMDYVRQRGDSGEWVIDGGDDFAPSVTGAAARLEIATAGEIVSIAAAADDGQWKITMTADDSRRVIGGEWGYAFLLTTAEKQRTLESGQVVVYDAADIPAPAERLRLLEAIYNQKAAFRGDVRDYAVGNTNYGTMSFAELRAEINAAREQLSIAKYGKIRRHRLTGGGY